MTISDKNILVKLVRSTFGVKRLYDMPPNKFLFIGSVLLSIILLPLAIWSHLMNIISKKYEFNVIYGFVILCITTLIGFKIGFDGIFGTNSIDWDLSFKWLMLYPATLFGGVILIIFCFVGMVLSLPIIWVKERVESWWDNMKDNSKMKYRRDDE